MFEYRSRPALMAAICLSATIACATAAQAHHSTSEFDLNTTLTLEGAVQTTQWSNPHCYLTLVTQDKAGKTQVWRLEYGTPGVNVRMGWQRDSVKAGDKVTVDIAPAANGSQNGAILTATMSDKRQFHTPLFYLKKK